MTAQNPFDDLQIPRSAAVDLPGDRFMRDFKATSGFDKNQQVDQGFNKDEEISELILFFQKWRPKAEKRASVNAIMHIVRPEEYIDGFGPIVLPAPVRFIRRNRHSGANGAQMLRQ